MTRYDLSARFIESLAAQIDPGDRIVAAVSGGCDSVALLHLLIKARDELDFHLALCHMNHKLRGDHADRDEQSVRQLAQTWSIDGFFTDIDVRAAHTQAGGSLEQLARELRYRFYQTAADHFNANRIALGHHRDDQCETIIFNIARGASIHGLRGIPASRPLTPDSATTIIRPLLGFSKCELQHHLRTASVSWREDHTNYQLGPTRNVIRHKLMPVIEQIHSGFADHLLQLANQAQQCETLLADQLTRLTPAVRHTDRSSSIETWRVNTLPELLAGEIVRYMMTTQAIPAGRITSGHILAVLDISTAATGRVDLPAKRSAWIDNAQLFIGRPPTTNRKDPASPTTWTTRTCQVAGVSFTKLTRNFDRPWFDDFLRRKTHCEEAIDADTITPPLVIRFARPGDRFHPLGSPGSKKVGDFLTDQKVPPADRPAIIVADNSGPVWLVGHRIDERVRIKTSTRNVMIIQTGPTNDASPG